MIARRPASPGTLAAIAVLPAAAWLWPALFRRQAPSFRDQGDFFYPLKLYTADRLARGEIPLWNALSGLGEPWIANLQSGAFYPPTWLFLLPGAGLAAGLYLLFHFAVGAWGCAHFLKEEGVSDAGALAGAVLFCASGFAASLSAYWNHFGAWCWMPSIVWLARRGLRSRGSRLAFALLLGLQAMAGSPEMSAATICLSILFAWRAPSLSSGWVESRRRRLLRLAAASALGLALAAWALLPFGELLLHSDRRAPLAAAERDVGAAGWGTFSSAAGVGGQANANSYLASLYLGPAALLAAIAAGLERSRRRLVLALLAVAVAGILLAAPGPPGSWLRVLPPLDRIRFPAKALGLTFFSVPILAGLGLDGLRFNRPLPRLRFLAPVAAAGAALLLFSKWRGPVMVAAAASFVFLLLLAVFAERLDRGAGVLAFLVALALGVSLWGAGRDLFRYVDEGEIRRPAATSEFLARIPGRVLTPPFLDLFRWAIRDALFDAADLRRQRESLMGYTGLLAGVSTTRTAAPLETSSAARVAQAIDGGGETSPVAGRVSSRVLWMPFQPSHLGSRKVGEFFRAPLIPYRSRLSVVTRYRVEPDPSRALERVLANSPSDEAENESVRLDRGPIPAFPSGPHRFLLARLAVDLPERVAADVQCDTAAIVVLADLFYPGWTASVDERPAPLLRADGLFRAVAVPSGSHRVEFRYRPLSFLVGAAVSAAGLLLLVFLAFSGEPGARSLL